ncbi:MAG TPA: hypothetical protein PKH65_06505 [Bacteroidia bacterium]|nr:hypothetical protein [Bacteroidia bacterium]HNT80318.1 hypothetical protein [Bacteroidia bacterium]
MKRIAFLILLIGFAKHLLAQPMASTNVLLFPYDPIYYMSDAENDIQQQSGEKDLKKIRNYFHEQSYDFVQRNLSRKYSCYAPMNDTSAAAYQLLVEVFKHTGYVMADPVVPDTSERKKLLSRLAFLKHNTEKSENEVNDDIDIAAEYHYIEDQKYLQASINKKELFKTIQNTYGSNYLVFLNQLEIKTDYINCIDASNKIYPRFVKMHYTIYNAQGAVVAGNTAIAEFKSSTSHFETIRNICFERVAEQISGDIENINRKNKSEESASD